MFSKFFIERPIFATVISLILVIAGLVAYRALPVAMYPQITPVTIQVTTTYPGADSKTVKRLIEARPVTAILLLQYLYGLRLVGAVALGLTEFSLLRFVLYQIVNCLVWAGLIGGVAYLLGGLVTEIFHGWFKWIWMVASAVLVVLLLRFVDRLLDRIQA